MLEDLHQIDGDLPDPETQRLQLAKARIGQGLSSGKRVILLDQACRVTGVTDTRVLIASHIKPEVIQQRRIDQRLQRHPAGRRMLTHCSTTT